MFRIKTMNKISPTGLAVLDAGRFSVSEAVENEDGGVTVFAVNKDLTEDVCLTVDLRAFPGLRVAEHIQLHHDDVKARNTLENPNEVAPTAGEGGKIEDGRLQVRLGNLSWNVIRLEKAE